MCMSPFHPASLRLSTFHDALRSVATCVRCYHTTGACRSVRILLRSRRAPATLRAATRTIHVERAIVRAMMSTRTVDLRYGVGHGSHQDRFSRREGLALHVGKGTSWRLWVVSHDGRASTSSYPSSVPSPAPSPLRITTTYGTHGGAASRQNSPGPRPAPAPLRFTSLRSSQFPRRLDKRGGAWERSAEDSLPDAGGDSGAVLHLECPPPRFWGVGPPQCSPPRPMGWQHPLDSRMDRGSGGADPFREIRVRGCGRSSQTQTRRCRAFEKEEDGRNGPTRRNRHATGRGKQVEARGHGVPSRIGIGIDVGRECLLVRLGWISRVPDNPPPIHRSMERGTAMEGEAMDNMQPAWNLIEKKMV